MRKITWLLAIFLAAACAGSELEEAVRSDWLEVLRLKRAWTEAGPEATVEAKQRYANALRAFVERYPSHARARDAYEELELDHARLLARAGRVDEAATYYRSVLRTNPSHEVAQAELQSLEDRRYLTSAHLGGLEVGMSRDQVAERIGRPLPGWSRRMERSGASSEAWYFRREGGGVAGVFFQDGRLIAAELESSFPLAAP